MPRYIDADALKSYWLERYNLRDTVGVNQVVDAIVAAPTAKAGLRCAVSWISVDERLPENGEYVLCVSGAGIIQIALFDSSVYVYGFYSNSVTHWQPLPAPPAKEEG